MSQPKVRLRMRKTPIEQHDTAAWADIVGKKECSKVPRPDAIDVEFARAWVNFNQK